MGKSIVPGKGIEITKQEQRTIFSQTGIEIQREGKPISLERLETGSVYLVVDCSGSMEGNCLNQAKRGAINFAKEARTRGYSVGLIKFANDAIHLSEPKREISALFPTINNMSADGTTNMSEAIRLAVQKLKDRKGFRAMVIVTDGMPDSPEDARYKAQEAKKKGIDIITIGTDDADREFLRKLASRTELGVKVSIEQFEKGIISTARMLPQLEAPNDGK